MSRRGSGSARPPRDANARRSPAERPTADQRNDATNGRGAGDPFTSGSGRRLAVASAELAERDPVIADLFARHGPCRLRASAPVASRFGSLVRSISFQQLAGGAARAIHGRLVATLDGDVTPERVLTAGDGTLRATGLSAAKVLAIVDLATKVQDGTVALGRLGFMDDESVVETLAQVRGVGRWTAEMFLMTSLGRLDVWPVGDLGVRAGYAWAWELAATPAPRDLAGLGERFRPHRSIVAWYCWRAMEDKWASERATRRHAAPREACGGEIA